MIKFLNGQVESTVHKYKPWSLEMTQEKFIEFIQDNFQVCFNRLSKILRVDYTIHQEISERRAESFVESIISNIYMYEMNHYSPTTTGEKKIYKEILKKYRTELRNKENSFKRTVLKLIKTGNPKTAQKLAGLTYKAMDLNDKYVLLEMYVHPKVYMKLPNYQAEHHFSKEEVKRNILLSLDRLDVQCQNQLDKIIINLPIT